MKTQTTYEKKGAWLLALYLAFGAPVFMCIGIPALSNQAFAQKFTAAVSKNKVAAGEMFQLDFTINANAKNFTPPSFNNFNVYSGPNQSSSMQIINGTMSQSITLSYFLSAKKEGTFTIGAAYIVSGNNNLQSNPITIEVSKGNPQNQANNGGNAQAAQEDNNNTLFVRTSVSKTKAYVGEQIIVTHKVYTRRNLKGFQDAKFPTYEGFFVQDLDGTPQYEINQENVDGATYSVVEIKRSFLFPQRSGKIEINPIEVECVVREKTGRSNDPFEQIFGGDPFFGGYKDILYKIQSKPISIDVLPLPDKPATFSGAVGEFSMNATLDKQEVKENEAINLKVTVSGKGNLKLIDAPRLDFPAEFETYDPKTNENIHVNREGASGSKTFEYLIIPRRAGTYKLPTIDFRYFDSEKKTYVALPSKEFDINVAKGDGTANAGTPIFAGASKEEVKMTGNDIRFIKTNNISLTKKGKYFFSSPLFIAGFSIPPLLFLVFLFARRDYIRKNSDLVAVKKRKASRLAKKQLQQAANAMKANDKENFYINVLAALYTYVGNKANIPVADMSKEKVTEVLKQKKISDENIQKLIQLLDECEFARFAPGSQSGDLGSVYNRSETIITKIEDAIA